MYQPGCSNSTCSFTLIYLNIVRCCIYCFSKINIAILQPYAEILIYIQRCPHLQMGEITEHNIVGGYGDDPRWLSHI